MSEASEFRRYADEALRWAAKATTEKERRSLMRLACTWAEAAAMSQNPMLVDVNDSPPEARAVLQANS
jgi:hypothetical protein